MFVPIFLFWCIYIYIYIYAHVYDYVVFGIGGFMLYLANKASWGQTKISFPSFFYGILWVYQPQGFHHGTYLAGLVNPNATLIHWILGRVDA